MTGPAGTTRGELLRQLAVAAELEQGLCLQYLFTAATVKDRIDEGGLTDTELLAARTWKGTMNFIAAQEMLHLAQVCNLALAVGGVPYLGRPNFPQRPDYYPTGLPWGLWPFQQQVVELYACYERPATWHRPPPDWLPLVEPADRAFPALLADAPPAKDPFAHLPGRFDRPQATGHETIGQLYAAIAEAFSALPGVIVGDPARQLDGRTMGIPQLVRVVDVPSALAAIELIVEQGEGLADDRPDSHFGAFLGIRRQLLEFSRRADFRPAREVAANPLSRLHVDNTFPGWRLITDPYTRAVNDLNSETYRVMLDLLQLVLGDGDAASGAAALRVMTGVIAPLAEALTQLPMGDDGSPGEADRPRFAGPSFEVDYPSPPCPPPPAGRLIAADRLRSCAAEAGRLASLGRAAEVGHGQATVLAAAAGNLADIARQLAPAT
ncbi:MAG TPA: ferritin-like domain-containing protein [Jatrophihabitans sp.]|nr:ferritin-like domain-containing protein [Jatrophihabitans sp.]